MTGGGVGRGVKRDNGHLCGSIVRQQTQRKKQKREGKKEGGKEKPNQGCQGRGQFKINRRHPRAQTGKVEGTTKEMQQKRSRI